MNICHIILTNNFAGSERYCSDLANYQSDIGHSVTLIIQKQLNKGKSIKNHLNKNINIEEIGLFFKKYQVLKILKKFKIQNKPLIANRDYFVLTSDYLVKGGDNMNFFKKSDSIFTLELKIRDILIDFFSKKDSLDIKSDNRFIYSN